MTPHDTAGPSTEAQRSLAPGRRRFDWQKAANVATTLVLPLTLLGVWLGYCNFVATNRAQAQAAVVR